MSDGVPDWAMWLWLGVAVVGIMVTAYLNGRHRWDAEPLMVFWFAWPPILAIAVAVMPIFLIQRMGERRRRKAESISTDLREAESELDAFLAGNSRK